MTLEHKIDFAVIISAKKCNPNGDPLNCNMPRVDDEGFGIISDVCLKRKIRNRMQDMGCDILMQSDDRKDDDCNSVRDRILADDSLDKKVGKNKDPQIFRKQACEKWIDVRSFGTVFAFKSNDGISIGVRGSVSIGAAQTIEPISISTMQITKSLNLETDKKDPYKKESSTMGTKYIMDKGVYVAYGSITTQLAQKTGFTNSDAEVIKQSLLTMYENDASAARPSGSIYVSEVYWWEHNCAVGQYPPHKVHQSLIITPEEEFPYYSVKINPLKGLTPEILS